MLSPSRPVATSTLLLIAIGTAFVAGYRLRAPLDGPSDPSADRLHASAAAPLTARSTAAVGGGANDRAGDGFGPALGDAQNGRMPGEFEPIDAIMLGINELLEFHPETLVEIVAALDGRTGVIGLVSHPDQERRALDLFESRGVATDRFVFFLWPAQSMWVHDFGPQQVVGEDVRIMDFEYAVTGREIDNQLPIAFAATFGMKVDHCHLTMEGGNLLSNGRGLCFSSNRLIEQNEHRGLDIQGVGRILNTAFGFQRWVYLMPLIGETTGHLDLFLTVAGPSTVLLASYDPAEDPDNAAQMDKNARTLASVVMPDGRPLEIIRIRQPAARDGCWWSYTNVIFGNGVVLVPQFPDAFPELDREAIAVYKRAFPDRRIVGIDTSSIIKKRGGLHCVSLSIPRVPGLPRPADR